MEFGASGLKIEEKFYSRHLAEMKCNMIGE